MKSSFIIVGSFVLGCLLAWLGWLHEDILQHSGEFSMYILYLLMFTVGVSIGSDRKLPEILKSQTPRILLVPLATVVGTLIAGLIVSFFISRWSISECLSVGFGFGYYSLSSILITQLKASSIGVQAAAELGTIALIANVIRELYVLLFTPLIVKYFGRLAPICAGGATTMDTTLPVITRFSGRDMVFISIIHAVIVDFSVPFFVGFFCSL
ncbi:MAG: lysine exporter LysO family protein [Tannerella sp.]|jgi:uncharacterized membrane protein YbjE (DUF340 family)|nr:lysine exporter LysO family protein [Tannerella sp.]